MKLIATTGAIVLAMLTTSVSAQPSDNAMRTLIVRSVDLDLFDRKDVRTLNNRLNVAIVDVCGSASPIDLEGAAFPDRALSSVS
jgi:UrcA family protein